MTRHSIIFALFLLLVALVAPAQLAAAQSVTSYQAAYYNVGAPQPVQTESFLASAAVCNQAAPAANASTVNPTRIVFDDVANANKVCVITEPANGTLPSLPVGNFEGTLSAVNAAGANAESARVPFSRVALAGVLTNVRFVR